ncbi:hypothetical protein [Promicromonospora iranensis]|uniref:Membrane protein CcdC involved in cytochrome C biogenesis n=1 Tax=Promicromonospora iranensis TaxID=1105144 RepID=A0ABU2CVM2_9MICO|nr:hypothetical protein [Promicromonospora iranensis]MDR7385388.1 membrane protein CcdC involved in cytochrome C biogenesis [Promicromonospora iranensis]
MTASHDASGPDGFSEPPRETDDTSDRQSAAGVTAALVLALWFAIVLVVVGVQVLLNQIFGTGLEVGALPGVWDWTLTIAAAVGTWALVSSRHPRVGPPAEPDGISGRQSAVGVTVVLVLALWVAIVLVLATVQILLDRIFGITIEVGSLPGVWNWLLTFGLVAGTWAFVRSRHPAIGP